MTWSIGWVDSRRKAGQRTPVMDGVVAVAVHTEGLNCFPQDCKYTGEPPNGLSRCTTIQNGPANGIKENGNPYLKAAPLSALKQNGLLQSLAADCIPSKTEELSLEVERAQEEWDALEIIQPVPAEDLIPSTPISFNEALQHFQTTDLGGPLKNIQPTLHRTGFSAIAHFLFGPPRLHKDLVEERDLLFAIGQCSLDNGQAVHMRVLQTVYRKLTCTRADCPRYGPHWENVGFQGTDPATDLRGTGFLGLMHCLYFVMDPEILPLARDIYKLSQHPVQNFPFSVMSINMTRIALHALREEVLSKECNRRQQVVAVLNDFYVGTFLHLYQLWKTQRKTISDSGHVLKEVEMFAKKNPKQILKRLEGYLKERHSTSPDALIHNNPSSGDAGSQIGIQGTKEGKEMNFIGVCELPPETEGEARLI
ncbi:hypothetical protein DNTS_035003 [Danionella cerebrum]|uniref:ELMO domain-containing protein n=1 Tax=Danionella cerebrum TaxID=2873325 RepID=A0A553R7L4_9TELE|nr:hypothetical protein DNTS_035003 [Danionella translucida]